jgi:hypothetical protein
MGDRANRIRIAKEESFHFNGFFADNKVHQVLTVYYDEVISSVVAGLKESFQRSRNLPRIGKPIPLVVSGGTALPGGFRERFEKAVREAGLPIEIGEVRLASNPLHAAAKGALVAALAEM